MNTMSGKRVLEKCKKVRSQKSKSSFKKMGELGIDIKGKETGDKERQNI